MTGNTSYFYEEEEVYLKRKLVAFYNELGYIDDIVPSDVTSRKRLKRFIETRWMVDARTEGERKIIFGKVHINITSLDYFIK